MSSSIDPYGRGSEYAYRDGRGRVTFARWHTRAPGDAQKTMVISADGPVGEVAHEIASADPALALALARLGAAVPGAHLDMLMLEFAPGMAGVLSISAPRGLTVRLCRRDADAPIEVLTASTTDQPNRQEVAAILAFVGAVAEAADAPVALGASGNPHGTALLDAIGLKVAADRREHVLTAPQLAALAATCHAPTNPSTRTP